MGRAGPCSLSSPWMPLSAVPQFPHQRDPTEWKPHCPQAHVAHGKAPEGAPAARLVCGSGVGAVLGPQETPSRAETHRDEGPFLEIVLCEKVDSTDPGGGWRRGAAGGLSPSVNCTPITTGPQEELAGRGGVGSAPVYPAASGSKEPEEGGLSRLSSPRAVGRLWLGL